jgi:hypothetical protein
MKKTTWKYAFMVLLKLFGGVLVFAVEVIFGILTIAFGLITQGCKWMTDTSCDMLLRLLKDDDEAPEEPVSDEETAES